MTKYYEGNHLRAAEGGFVIWTSIIIPIELLQGFDVIVCTPESHAAMCAARKVGPMQCEKAEQAGFSMDLCSYARIDLGTVLDEGRGSPSLGLPKPDLLISHNANCSLLVKWFDVYRRWFGVPHFILDVPFCYQTQQEKDRRYLLDQFQDLIRLIESLTGQKFDYDQVREAVGNSNEALKHWTRFLQLAGRHPAGITAFDTFAHMVPPLTWMRGTPEVTEHFKLLAEETQMDMEAGRFPVPNEKYRLLWDSIAPWHQLRTMLNRLAELDANIVWSSYASSLGRIENSIDFYEWDGRDPLHYLARIQNNAWCAYGLELRYKSLKEMIERYDIHGLVFASNRSCKVYSIMQMDLQRRLTRNLGLPAVMVDVDHADVRKYNEANFMLKVETMLEIIKADRG